MIQLAGGGSSVSDWAKGCLVEIRAGLSLADAWNAALALMLGAELIHKDPEYDEVPDLKHRRLPYKKP